MVKLSLRMEKSDKIKAAIALAALLAFAFFFYRLFNPRDVPGLLTYFIFFVMVPSYVVYYIAGKLIPEKEKVEVVE